MTTLTPGVHQVAYRCRDAKQTVQWYQKHLNMGFVLAIAEDKVPSTGEPNPYMHIFLDAGGGKFWHFLSCPRVLIWGEMKIHPFGHSIWH